MLEGIQMGQAIALLTIVAAEMMGATSGIGFLIWTSYKAFLLTRNVCRAHPDFIFWLSILTLASRNTEENVTVEVSGWERNKNCNP